MAVTIQWSQPARVQLREIFDCHLAVAGMRTARKLVSRIADHVDILRDNPRAGQREELVKDLSDEFRYLVDGHYKIVYRITDENIVILAVFDCRQNPEKMRDIK